MAGGRNHAPLEQLLDEIKFQRRQVVQLSKREGGMISFEIRKELRSFCQDPGFTIAHNTTYWTDLFVRHFLFQVSNRCRFIFSLSPCFSLVLNQALLLQATWFSTYFLTQADTAIDSDDLLFFVRKRQAIYFLKSYNFSKKKCKNMSKKVCIQSIKTYCNSVHMRLRRLSIINPNLF